MNNIDKEIHNNGLSVSRFNMWRAVFAMAHVDHVVTEEEKDFIRSYLDNIPFSEEQRTILLDDMNNPCPVADVFDEITDMEDRGAFFQFASMLCWSDGHYDVHEEALKEKLKAAQMKDLDMDYLGDVVKRTREVGEMERAGEEQAFEDSAKGLLGLGAFFKKKG